MTTKKFWKWQHSMIIVELFLVSLERHLLQFPVIMKGCSMKHFSKHDITGQDRMEIGRIGSIWIWLWHIDMLLEMLVASHWINWYKESIIPKSYLLQQYKKISHTFCHRNSCWLPCLGKAVGFYVSDEGILFLKWGLYDTPDCSLIVKLYSE